MADNRKILALTELSDKHTNDVLKLLELCQNTYHTEEVCFMEEDINCLEEAPCYYLAYEDNTLVCFLSAFTPDELSCELYSLTRPGYEDSGVFELLINVAIETLEELGITDFFFVTDTNDKINSSYMEKYYIEADSSTLLLELNVNYPYVFKDINPDSGEDYIFELNIETQENEEDGSINHTIDFLRNGEAVGFAECEQYSSSFCIHHVEIEESLRGKGHGKELLTDLLTYCLSVAAGTCKGKEPVKFILNADTDNVPACRLYKGFGFECTQQIDYYYV